MSPENTTRGRILAISDAPFLATGYGTQSSALMSEMVNRGWEVFHFACNFLPPKDQKPDPALQLYRGIRNIMLDTNKGPEHYYPSSEIVKHWYDALHPDIVWSLIDFHLVAPYLMLGSDFIERWVHWLPVDSYIRTWSIFERKLKYLVYMTDFGREIESQSTGPMHFNSRIYLGADTSVFRPLPDKHTVKSRHGLQKFFVILTVARHQPRKMVYHTAHAVCAFLRSHPDSFWVCKANPDDVMMKQETEEERNLLKLVESYGVKGRVLFVPQVLPTNELNDMYNTADAFISLTGGEGFNLPLAEAMLAGTPCIVTSSTSGPELLKGGELGFLAALKPQKKFVRLYGTFFDIASLEDAQKHLETCYKNWKSNYSMLADMIAKAREFALGNFSHKAIADQWESVFSMIKEAAAQQPRT